MSEAVSPQGAYGREPGLLGKGWHAIKRFYRIRPVPGADGAAGSGTISFNDLFREFVADWRILLTGLLAGLLVAIFVIVSAAPTYEATLTVAAAESSLADSGGSVGSAGGGSANVLSLFVKGGGQYDDFAQFLDTTHSVRLATRLNAKYDLMKKVFPFDKETDAFVPPSNMTARLARTVRWMLGLQPWAPPNMVSLAAYLKGVVEIRAGEDGISTLAYYGPTAEAASSFLASVYEETSELMRQEKLISHRKRLEYLGQRLSDTTALDQRTLLISLWGREQAQLLLLTGGEPVGARMIDDIHVPNMPQNGAALKLAMGILSGLLLGMFVAIGRSAYRRA